MKARHTVLATLFVTWIVSFMDRLAISIALPYISTEFHLTPLAGGAVMSAFFAGYVITQIPGGLLADRFGVRRVASFAMLWWSAFTALTGAAAGMAQMMAARFLFGLGEGVFPACAFKTIAIWFPKRERATATAIMTASNPLGAALSPLVVVAIMSAWGWRAVFYGLFFLGLLATLAFWTIVVDRPSDRPRISAGELREIEDGEESETPGPRPRLGEILRRPNVFKYFLTTFFFGTALWGFMTWLPTYLVKARGFSMAEMGVGASLPFFAGTAGSLLGGWLSDRYFRNARKIPIVAALLVTAAALIVIANSQSIMVLMISQAAVGFFLQIYQTSFWALPMNSVPRSLMGVTAGFINMASQIAAFISPIAIGALLQITDGDFSFIFMALGASLLVACAIVGTISTASEDRTAV